MNTKLWYYLFWLWMAPQIDFCSKQKCMASNLTERGGYMREDSIIFHPIPSRPNHRCRGRGNNINCGYESGAAFGELSFIVVTVEWICITIMIYYRNVHRPRLQSFCQINHEKNNKKTAGVRNGNRRLRGHRGRKDLIWDKTNLQMMHFQFSCTEINGRKRLVQMQSVHVRRRQRLDRV